MQDVTFRAIVRNPRSIGANLNSPISRTYDNTRINSKQQDSTQQNKMPQFLNFSRGSMRNSARPENKQPNLSQKEKIIQFLNLESPKMQKIYANAGFYKILLPKGTIWDYSHENAEMALKLFGCFVYSDLWGVLHLAECEIEVSYITEEELAQKRADKFFSDGCMDRPSRKRTHINR